MRRKECDYDVSAIQENWREMHFIITVELIYYYSNGGWSRNRTDSEPCRVARWR